MKRKKTTKPKKRKASTQDSPCTSCPTCAKSISQLTEMVLEYINERRVLAKLAAKGPCFNPFLKTYETRAPV